MHNTYPRATDPEAFDGSPQPSYFEGMDSPEQVLPEYERLMGEAAAKHQQKFTESYNPANLGTYLNETSEEVDDIIATAGTALAPMLDEESSAMLAHIRGRAKLMGPDSFIVEDLVQAAPLAVRVVYDTDVLQQARKRTAAWGADLTKSSPRRQILNNASSPTVLGAMNAALDKELHDYAQQQTPYERNTHGGKRVFNGASSEAVQEALEQQRAASEHSQQTQGARADQSRSRTGSDPESIRVAGGDLFKGKAGGAVFDALFGEAAKSPRSKTDKPTEVVPDRDPAQEQQRRVKTIIDRTAKNKKYEWIKSESDVATRVVEYVDGRRQQAAKDGKTLTAKQLYVELRHTAETDPSRTGEVQALEAMMGGVDGELPF